jgi:hypothetical protein
MPAKRPNRVIVLVMTVFLAIGGIGWLIQGLIAWDFFRTMTGGYILAMALWLASGWRDERRQRVPEDPEQPSATNDAK